MVRMHFLRKEDHELKIKKCINHVNSCCGV